MIAQTLPTVVVAPKAIQAPNGQFLHVVMLQVHVVMASLWAVAAILAATMAVPQLRRIPSAFGLHVLQIKRTLLLEVLWGSYILAFGTGTWLLFKQAIYSPPFSGSAWSELRHEPYGIPYYYALYGKIIIFFLMGFATVVLARGAVLASKASEAEGGPVELDLEVDDSPWLDEEVMPDGAGDKLGLSGAVASATRTGTRTPVAAKRRPVGPTTSPILLWASVAMIGAGLGGVSFCVTLIKYFHELSKSAVVYQILTRS
jgi:hypothetical protein